MRMLGLIMIFVGFIICGSEYYIIKVGFFPANLALTCTFWAIVGIVGLIIFATHPAKGNKPPDADGK